MIRSLSSVLFVGRFTDASPEEWQRLVGVPIDTHRHINLLLAGGVTFQSMQDLLAGELNCLWLLVVIFAEVWIPQRTCQHELPHLFNRKQDMQYIWI